MTRLARPCTRPSVVDGSSTPPNTWKSGRITTIDAFSRSRGTEPDQNGAKPQLGPHFAWSRKGFESPLLHPLLHQTRRLTIKKFARTLTSTQKRDVKDSRRKL